MAGERGDAPGAGPVPEPLRFFGTTWVDRGAGYAVRRVAVAAGALLAAAAAALVLRLAYLGAAGGGGGGVVRLLLVVVFAACSALAFRRTWERFVRRPEAADAAAERSLRAVRAVGCVGVLLAWFCRSLVEAPGEGLLRQEYERERERHARRRSQRAGNPASRSRRGRSGRR